FCGQVKAPVKPVKDKVDVSVNKGSSSVKAPVKENVNPKSKSAVSKDKPKQKEKSIVQELSVRVSRLGNTCKSKKEDSSSDDDDVDSSSDDVDSSRIGRNVSVYDYPVKLNIFLLSYSFGRTILVDQVLFENALE
ncbi:hypothetical protein Tco_1573350, partial [Tanacetum coccineum]